MILITGASSYVGSRLYSDLSRKFKVVGTYHRNRNNSELVHLDITNPDEIINTLVRFIPSTIIHVAANSSASYLEKNPRVACDLNKQGTANIVDAANEIKAKVIFISSYAAIEASNMYGASKLAGECAVRNAKKGYVILRPSLIIGQSPNTTNDRPHNRIFKNILNGTPAVYDTSWRFQPTWLGHISECIEAILENGITNQTIPVAVPELKSRYDVARDILREFGVAVTPEDNNDRTPAIKLSLEGLAKLGLPVYNYSGIIEQTVREIKQAIK